MERYEDGETMRSGNCLRKKKNAQIKTLQCGKRNRNLPPLPTPHLNPPVKEPGPNLQISF